MRSIRKRLTTTVLGGTLAVWLACGAGLYGYMRHALTNEFDARSADQSRAFAAFTLYEEEEFDEETETTLDDLPESIRLAIQRRTEGTAIEEIERVIRAGQVFYKVEAIRNGVEGEFLVSGTGQYLGAIDEYNFAYSRAALPEFQPGPGAAYFQVWDDEGATIAKSPSLKGGTLVPFPDAQSRIAFDTELPDGRAGRALVTWFRPQGDDTERVMLAMARSREELNRALSIILTALAFGGGIMALLTAFFVKRYVGRGLAPLDALAQETNAISANELSLRFNANELPVELEPIVSRLNALLERLEHAFTREKRFTSDVAHELRTPIAELRTLAEVRLNSNTTAGPIQDRVPYFQDALDIAIQMERLVDHLLTLRRCESGNQALQVCETDFSSLAGRAWRPFEEAAKARSLRTDFELPVEANLETDPALLSAILTNLYSNAVSYSPEGGQIAMKLQSENGAWRFDISNTNSTLNEDDVSKMSEPFWRKDAARADSAHSGLGLSVVTAFARLLHADVSTEIGKDATVRVSLKHPTERESIVTETD